MFRAIFTGSFRDELHLAGFAVNGTVIVVKFPLKCRKFESYLRS